MFKIKTMAMFAGVSVLLVGCAANNYIPNTNVASLANPASSYCEKIGGQSLILVKEKVTSNDGDIGYCRLADGTVTEEWKLYHARNKK